MCETTDFKIRDVKDWYVEYLADQMVKDNEDFEELTAPLVVIASIKKNDFKAHNINQYKYQVVGGVHRFYALKMLQEKGRNIVTRKCAVYGCGISRSGILRLANQHNEVNRVQRATSLSEVAASCRRLMFVHFGEGMDDDGTQMPQIPRYNSQPYIKWKSECLSYLSSPTTVSLTLLCE